ncbi:MAG: DNA gyrase subunit A [Clostridia bacterium]|nr:DNA gyrase subunit A [Clostridia bacterium]
MADDINENNNGEIEETVQDSPIIKDKIKPIDVEAEMKRAFIEYSMSVIVDRALPDVRDGMKPVHRRIVYSLFEQGFTPDSSYRKCATTVGYVMGKYHPHGDAAIYDSLVRLAQDFSMRYVLVDGNGNFGSRDNDPPAASRYTEARMAKIANEMVADIRKNTVDFRPNFDEHEMEPEVLPSRFPNLLVNGSSGIAVGMATEIPTHNLREVIDGVVAMIDDPDITIDGLMQYIKGPDFPTAANIIGRQGIREAYHTGKGRIVVRAEAAIEDMPGGRQRIVVTELPYKVNNAQLVKRIADLHKEKRIEGISDLRDEYSKKGIRIVMELKQHVNANVLLNQLYANTPLQEAYCANMVALVPGENGKYEPKQLNLKEMLKYYIDHQKNVVTRRTQFDLDKARDRAHVLEGTLIAIDNIEEVIRIIRSSRLEQEAKEKLMERFDFTERQAQYIVDLRLGRLTGLERDKILEEYNQKLADIAYFTSLLDDDVKMFDVIKSELIAIKEKYGDDRRTKILDAENEIPLEDLIEEKDIAITLTQHGYVKRTPSDTYRAQNRGGKGVLGLTTKEEDFIQHLIVVSSHDLVMFVTNFGRLFGIKGYEIPDAGRTAKGMPIVNLIPLEPSEKVQTIIPIRSFEDAQYLTMCTKNGIVKKSRLDLYKNLRKSGLRAVDLREGDELVNAILTNDGDKFIVCTKKGFTVKFDGELARAVGRTSFGVIAIRPGADDYVIGFDVVRDPEDKVLFISENGFGKRTPASDFSEHGRGGKGMRSYRVTEKTGPLCGLVVAGDDKDVMIINLTGTVIRIHVRDISTTGRVASGVTLMKATADNPVVSFTTVAMSDEETSKPEAAPESEEDLEGAENEAESVNGELETNEGELEVPEGPEGSEEDAADGEQEPENSEDI